MKRKTSKRQLRGNGILDWIRPTKIASSAIDWLIDNVSDDPVGKLIYGPSHNPGKSETRNFLAKYHIYNKDDRYTPLNIMGELGFGRARKKRAKVKVQSILPVSDDSLHQQLQTAIQINNAKKHLYYMT